MYCFCYCCLFPCPGFWALDSACVETVSGWDQLMKCLKLCLKSVCPSYITWQIMRNRTLHCAFPTKKSMSYIILFTLILVYIILTIIHIRWYISESQPKQWHKSCNSLHPLFHVFEICCIWLHSKQTFLGLLRVWTHTFGLRKPGLWVWPVIHQSPSSVMERSIQV